VTPDFMRETDEGFRRTSGLKTKSEYKIFYSHVHPFPLLVLGQNPGGASDGPSYVASDSYFENWEHDFVRFRTNPSYALAAPMWHLLSAALHTTSDDVLRQVPVTNVIFRRSQRTESLSIKLVDAALEARSALTNIVCCVSPTLILFLSKTAFDLFTRVHCDARTVVEDPEGQVFTPNGRNQACIYLRARGRVSALGRYAEFVVVGHPSKYAGRVEWTQVTLSVKTVFQELGLVPIEQVVQLRSGFACEA
jgi:hypothetical protein